MQRSAYWECTPIVEQILARSVLQDLTTRRSHRALLSLRLHQLSKATTQERARIHPPDFQLHGAEGDGLELLA